MTHIELEFDPRGNTLRAFEIRSEPLRLLLNADYAVYRQIQRFIASDGVVARPIPFPEAEASRWTYCLELSRMPNGLEPFLRLLERVLVLKGLPFPIDDAIAVDFYKIPRPGVDPDQWPDTEIGELVNRMKYRKADPGAQRLALGQLADRMATVLRGHPHYRAAVLISTPGHDRSQSSWSEGLAGEVGRLVGAPIIGARAHNLLRPEAKARTERVDFKDEFEIPSIEVAGRAVLVIDDVLGRGTTMQGVAAAARRAGARSVHGLVAARTIR